MPVKRGHAAQVVSIQPIFLAKHDAATYLSISESHLERLVAAGDVPPPRKLSKGRAAWLVEELSAWARSRPISDLLPPENGGYGRAGKPARGTEISTARQGPRSAGANDERPESR